MLIRPARLDDGPRVVDLIRELAAFEKLPAPDEAAGQRLLRDCFPAPDGAPARVQMWVAEEGGEVCAYAAWFETYSTFTARPSLFLEDLFVHPAARRRGVATALLLALRAEAERRGCGRFEWFVLDWNTDAQELYRRVGARMVDEWRLMRVDL